MVNLRLGSVEGSSDASIADEFGALAELRQEGLIRHLGLSGVSSAHLRENTAAADLKLPADEVAELNTPAPDQPRRRSRKTIRRAASNRRATELGR